MRPGRRSGHAHAGGRQPDATAARPEEPIDRRPELLADSRARARLGAIELIVVAVVMAAVVALLVWFFFFAHNPLLRS
jgi:hypothetical protein